MTYNDNDGAKKLTANVTYQKENAEDSHRDKFENVLKASQTQCYQVLHEHDSALIEGWNRELDTLLVFVSNII